MIYDQNSTNPIIVTDGDGTDNNKVDAVCVGMILDSGKRMVFIFHIFMIWSSMSMKKKVRAASIIHVEWLGSLIDR